MGRGNDLEGYESRIRRPWESLAQAAFLITGIIGGFLLPPAFGNTQEDQKLWPKLAGFVVTILVGLAFIAGRKWSHENHLMGWWLCSILLLGVSVAAYIGYEHLARSWSCIYNNRPVLIGTVETQLAKERRETHPNEASCEELLKAAAGHVDWVYTPESIERCRVLLQATYISIVPILTVCVVTLLQAIQILTGSRVKRDPTSAQRVAQHSRSEASARTEQTQERRIGEARPRRRK